MNLRDLRYIVAVADLAHFGKAAEQCHVSQPTLSGQVKKLEQQLGVLLFERTNRSVMPTEVGLRIVTLAKQILRDADAIEEAAQLSQDPLAGNFRLGAFPTLSTYLFPELAPLLSHKLPHLRLILVEEKTQQLIEQLHEGALDAALLALPVHDDKLMSLPLFEDPFYLAVGADHPLASRGSVQLDQLSSQPLLLLDEGHCLRDQALDVCQLHALEVEQDFRATGLETLRQMVKIGTGITLMPEIAIRENEPDIVYLPIVPPPSRTIGLVWRKTSTRMPVIQTLVSCYE